MLYWLRRLVAWLCRSRLDRELQGEIQYHLELRQQQLIDHGLEPRQAMAVARQRFGNPTRVREETRDLWGIPSIDSTVQDVRYGARLLWRAPSFTAVAVLSLALGIGSTAAVFSIADAVLFRPLAVTAPHELHEFRATAGLGAAVKHLNSVSEDGLRIMSQAADFGQLVGFRTFDHAHLGAGGEQQPVRVELVSDTYFEVLGVQTSAGRLLTDSDTGHAPVPAVLSERLWRARFGADPDVIGRSTELNGTSVIIVGVARAFRGLLAERPADVMVPATAGALIDSAAASTGLRVLVRLRPGVPAALADDRMAALYKQVAPDPLQRADIRVRLTDARRGASDARETLQRPIALGLALVGVLMLIACANTGGLLLARFTSRAGEFGIRIAVGAGRTRLMRQLTVEALLIGTLAAGAGLLVVQVAAPLLLVLIPVGSQPLDFELRFDWRLAGFVAALGTCAGLLAGAVPLLRLMHSDTATILTRNTRSVVQGRRRLTEALIASQVACSLLLLIAAGAMTRTLLNLGRVNPGFDPSGVIAINVDATGRTSDDVSLRAYYAQLRERLASAPQVVAVTSAQFGLMTSSVTTGTVDVDGWSPVSDDDRWAQMFWVGPNFFDVLRMPLLAGNVLGQHETAGSERVAVVNRSFAEFYFGGVAEAIDRTVNEDVRIVGVTADAHYGTLRDQPVRAMFVPYSQAPTRSVRTFFLRTTGEASRAVSSALGAIRAHDATLRANGTTLTEQISSTLSRERFVAVLAAALAGLALLLSCAGLYAAVAYSVSERRNELAIRLALGATGRDVVRLVLTGPLQVTTIGLILGVPGAYAMMRTLRTMLFEVAPFDLPALAVSGVALLAVATAAALWPARRAATINPQESLKIT